MGTLRLRAPSTRPYVRFDVFKDVAGRVISRTLEHSNTRTLEHSIPVLGHERGSKLPTTTKKDAKKTGKKLGAKSSTKAQKSAAASDLAQAKRPTGRTSKKKK